MFRSILGLLYFFRFNFAFLFVDSYIRWEVCALASHHHVFCFKSKDEVKSLRTGGEVKHFRTGGVTVLWGRLFLPLQGGGDVSTPLHAMKICFPEDFGLFVLLVPILVFQV